MCEDYDQTIYLNGYKLKSKEIAIPYLKQVFHLPVYIGNNLDAIYDGLSEIEEKVEILLSRECVTRICECKYAFKVLMMLGNVVDENPNLHIFFRE